MVAAGNKAKRLSLVNHTTKTIHDHDINAYTKMYQKHILCTFAYKVVCIDDRFSKPVVFYRGKNGVNKFIVTIIKEKDIAKNYKKSFQ